MCATPSKKITGDVYIMGNGMVATFHRGEQVPELQVSLVDFWARHAASLGYDPEGLIVNIADRKFRIIKRGEGDGWTHELC